MKVLFFSLQLALAVLVFAQHKNYSEEKNYVIISKGETFDSIVYKAANVVPSYRQMEWQKLELTAFLHFGMNTFTNKEWGEGKEAESTFFPTNFDANQIVNVCKNAGIKLIIITAKHHDGFCLWQTKYTEYCVRNSLWRNGKGDVVKDLAEACKKANIKFGIYLSPWDRHEKTYGDSVKYNTFFINQLTELLTNYGEISEVWFDGACGEGLNGKKQKYDWDSYYKTIRQLQPNAVISVMGPDVRWVGTEDGYGRNTEWSVVPIDMQNQEKIAENSQHNELTAGFIPVDMIQEDLGSRDKLIGAKKLVWYPSEVDVSIRPGWFYHENEDKSVKSSEKLFDIYLNAVGRNNSLLLNIPPDKTGRINENDIKSLLGFKQLIDQTFSDNLSKDAKITVSSKKENFKSLSLIDDNYNTFWMADEKTSTAEIILEFKEVKNFNIIVLQENIGIGQRIEEFKLYYWEDNGWKEISKGTTIGYKRILNFPTVTSNKVKLLIKKSRLNPTISFFGIYKTPPVINIYPEAGVFTDSMKINIESEKNTKLFYTLDGKEPDENSALYFDPIRITNSCVLKVIAISDEGKKSLVKTITYIKSDKGIKLKSMYSPNYPGCGNLALIDGKKGTIDLNNQNWQGYEGVDLDATIDLGKIKEIRLIEVSFLQNIPSWIFLPEKVEVSISEEGTNYTLVGNFEISNNQKQVDPSIETKQVKLNNIKTRYIRVYAKNIGFCPAWHAGKGCKAWLFVDEINIE